MKTCPIFTKIKYFAFFKLPAQLLTVIQLDLPFIAVHSQTFFTKERKKQPCNEEREARVFTISESARVEITVMTCTFV